jgi:hypothetical protein
MNKIILASIAAFLATGALAVDASATQRKSETTSTIKASDTYGYASARGSAFGLSNVGYEPIPGSITYGGQPKSRLLKAPVGSSFTHDFFSGAASYQETYTIQPDRSLKLVGRVMRDLD